MMARFSRCAMVTHWLLHTPVQIFFNLVLVYKKVSALFPLSIQTGILAVTFHITLISFIVTKETPKYEGDLFPSKTILLQ